MIIKPFVNSDVQKVEASNCYCVYVDENTPCSVGDMIRIKQHEGNSHNFEIKEIVLGPDKLIGLRFVA